METKYCVGLDLSKKDFKACMVVIDHKQNTKIKASRTFPNTASGSDQLWECDQSAEVPLSESQI